MTEREDEVTSRVTMLIMLVMSTRSTRSSRTHTCSPRMARCRMDTLERLHAGLVKLASMDEPVLAALVEHVLGDDELAPSS
jgi:hypothetical protein